MLSPAIQYGVLLTVCAASVEGDSGIYKVVAGYVKVFSRARG